MARPAGARVSGYDTRVLLIGSLVFVLGALGMLLLHGGESSELRFGYQQMIHARIPWLLLGSLGLGSALGIASLLRTRATYRYAVVGTEVLLSGLIAWYFVGFSFLPPHALAVDVGDPFPSYSLPDQDGQIHRVEASSPRPPALYIFYRGDW